MGIVAPVLQITHQAVPRWQDVEKLALQLCGERFWQVRRIMAFDDLMQEAALVFCRCLNGWHASKGKFSTMYHHALSNQITDHARQVTTKQAIRRTRTATDLYIDRSARDGDKRHPMDFAGGKPLVARPAWRLPVDAPAEVQQLLLSIQQGENVHQLMLRDRRDGIFTEPVRRWARELVEAGS